MIDKIYLRKKTGSNILLLLYKIPLFILLVTFIFLISCKKKKIYTYDLGDLRKVDHGLICCDLKVKIPLDRENPRGITVNSNGWNRHGEER